MQPDGSGAPGLHDVYSNGEVRDGEGPIWFGPHESGWVASWYPANQLADSSAPALWQNISGIGGAQLSGYYRAPSTGKVTLNLSADDWAELKIAGAYKVLDDVGGVSVTLELEPGKWYPLSINYENRRGTNSLNFSQTCE